MSTYNDIRTRFQVGMDKINEKEVPVGIDGNVVGTVDDSDTAVINTIKATVSSAGSKDAIISFLTGINFPENEANNLFNILSKSENIKTTAEYLLSRDITLASILGKPMTAKDINSRIGLIGKTSQLFYNFSWRTSPPMGPGEPWLSTILKDGRRPSGSEKGDVVVDKFELEVKGANGRLIGQSGYGDAKTVRTSLSTAVKNIASSLNISDYEVIDDGSDGFWNITKREGRGLEMNLKAIASRLGSPFSKKELALISNEIITALKSYLLNLDVKTYGSILIDVIGKDGSINLNKWHSAIITMYFEYYYGIEEFHYIAFTTNEGKFLISEPGKFKELYDKGIIVASSIPSFTNSAGSQGGTYGIKLK